MGSSGRIVPAQKPYKTIERPITPRERQSILEAHKAFRERYGEVRRVSWQEVHRMANLPKVITPNQVNDCYKNWEKSKRNRLATAGSTGLNQDADTATGATQQHEEESALVDWDRVARLVTTMGPFTYGSNEVLDVVRRVEPGLQDVGVWFRSKIKLEAALQKFPEWMQFAKQAVYPSTPEDLEAMYKKYKENLAQLKVKVEEEIKAQGERPATSQSVDRGEKHVSTVSSSSTAVKRRRLPMTGPLTLLEGDFLVVTPFITLRQLHRNAQRRVIIHPEKLNVEEWRRLMYTVFKAQKDLLHISPRALGEILNELKVATHEDEPDEMVIEKSPKQVKVEYYRYVLPQLNQVCDGYLINSIRPLPCTPNHMYILQAVVYYCLLHQSKLHQCLITFQENNILESDSTEFWKNEIPKQIEKRPDSRDNFNISGDYLQSFITRYM